MRNLGLDLIRFVAIVLVLFSHADLSQIQSPILDTLKMGGWAGVDLFFVLSGFLITSLLLREFKETGNVNLKRFLYRRIFKIYPPFLILILFSVLAYKSSHHLFSPSVIANEIFLIHNYTEGIWLHTWSIAAEVHFYLLICLILFICRRVVPKKIFHFFPFLFGTIATYCLLERYRLIAPANPYRYYQFAFYTHLRMDSFFFGTFLAYLLSNRQWKIEKRSALLLLTVGIALISPAFFFSHVTEKWVFTWGLTLLYLGSGCLVMGAISLESSTVNALRFLGYLGTISYSVFLWHMPLKVWGTSALNKFLPNASPSFKLTLYFVMAFIVGWVMNEIFEKPILKFREKQSRKYPSMLPTPLKALPERE